MPNRGYVVIYRRLPQKRLDQYMKEYPGRRNLREPDTIEQMSQLVMRFSEVQLSCADLVQDGATT